MVHQEIPVRSQEVGPLYLTASHAVPVKQVLHHQAPGGKARSKRYEELNSDRAGLTQSRRSRQVPRARVRGQTAVMDVGSPLRAWQAPPDLGCGEVQRGPNARGGKSETAPAATG